MSIDVESLESHEFRLVLYSSVAGAVFGFFISSILLTNVILFYLKMCRQSNNKQSKQKRIKQQSYLLVIIYLSSNCLACASYAFIRTNVISQINLNQWTTYQCSIGYILAYSSYYISVAMLYIIFIWKIKISFNGSVSEYNNYILYPFLAAIIIVISALLIQMIVLVSIPEWLLLHGNASNISYCLNMAIDKFIFSDIFSVLSIITTIFHIIMSSGLLYMFVRGLVLVNRILIKSFVREYAHVDSNDSNNGIFPTPFVHTETEMSKKHERTDTISVQTVFDECTDESRSPIERKELSKEASRILVLHDLVKKQTILVSVSIISSVLLWISSAIDDWLMQQMYWDMTINAVCVWLMLASSQKYWLLCKKSCLRCCYVKENSIYN
eukprot:418899_1